MTLNKRVDYGDYEDGQANKSESLNKATVFVKEIIENISPLLDSCDYYDSEKKLGGAPTVELPSKEIVIAPDIICKTHKGKIFWIEAKDKSQRFYKPDTGADIFQVYGWYKIWSELHQPVYVVFKDPKFNSCLPRKKVEQKWIDEFKNRWDLFQGNPYGGWLSELLVLKNGYPQIFDERSRDKPMSILYFHILLMKNSIKWEDIIKSVDNDKILKIQQGIKAYYNGDLLDQQRMKEKIDSLLGKN
jgi:hypothetical protein